MLGSIPGLAIPGLMSPGEAYFPAPAAEGQGNAEGFVAAAAAEGTLSASTAAGTIT